MCTKTATHLIPNTIPKTTLSEGMVLVNVTKLHKALIALRPLGLLEYVGRRSKYKLRALTAGAKAGIVEIGLDL